MSTDSFEELVVGLPDEILLVDGERDDLTGLARSADREAARAKGREEGHELGATMARFLVRFTELVASVDPENVERMVAEMRAAIAEADQRILERHHGDDEMRP